MEDLLVAGDDRIRDSKESGSPIVTTSGSHEQIVLSLRFPINGLRSYSCHFRIPKEGDGGGRMKARVLSTFSIIYG